MKKQQIFQEWDKIALDYIIEDQRLVRENFTDAHFIDDVWLNHYKGEVTDKTYFEFINKLYDEWVEQMPDRVSDMIDNYHEAELRRKNPYKYYGVRRY